MGVEMGVEQELARLTASLDVLDAQLTEVRETCISADRLIRATVSGHGELVELDLDPSICSDADDLAAAVLATVREAAAAAATRSAELVAALQQGDEDS